VGSLLLPGRVSDADLPYYLAACDVLALPLEDNVINRGRWPHKLGDMAAVERPVITSPGGEFPTWLERRSAAKVVRFEAEAFAAGIDELLRIPAAARNLAVRGRRAMVEELSWERVGAQVADIVEATRRETAGR